MKMQYLGQDKEQNQ